MTLGPRLLQRGMRVPEMLLSTTVSTANPLLVVQVRMVAP
jgi:hypothetical protein